MPGFKSTPIKISFITFIILHYFCTYLLSDTNYVNNFYGNTRIAGLSGAYSALSNDVAAIVTNPAGLTQMQNLSLQGTYNLFGPVGYHTVLLGFAIPVPPRSFIGVMQNYSLATSAPFFYFQIVGAYGLKFTDSFSSGIGVRLLRENVTGQTIGSGIDLGILYKVPVHLSWISQIKLASVIHTLTSRVRWDKNNNNVRWWEERSPINIVTGFTVDFNRKIILVYDLDYTSNFITHNFGQEYIFLTPLTLRTGISTNTQGNTLVSAGLSFEIPKLRSFVLDYAWQKRLFYPDTVDSHWVTFTYRWMKNLSNIDFYVRLETETISFIQVSAMEKKKPRWKLLITGPEVIQWKLKITNKSGTLVWEKERNEPLPREIGWDGRGSDGKVVKDGIYVFYLETVDTETQTKQFTGKFSVDSTVPEVALAIGDMTTFAPSKGEKIHFRGYVKDQTPVKWNLKVYPATQPSLRQPQSENIFTKINRFLFYLPKEKVEPEYIYIHSGEGNLDKTISWDGKLDKTTFIPPDKYKVYLTATDWVGNTTNSTPVFLTITLTPAVPEPRAKRPTTQPVRSEPSSKETPIRKPEQARGQTLRNTIYFDLSRAEVRVVGRRVLEQVARTLKMFPDKKIVIYGFYNTEESRKIAEDRVNAVQTVLTTELGVPETRIGLPKISPGTGESGRRVTIELK